VSSTQFARTVNTPFNPANSQPIGDNTIAGTRIGRYKTVSRIGDGAMGAVYAAYDPVLSRTVALKTLNLNLAPEERARFEASFLDEARAVAKLNHPNIVTVYDAGKSPHGPYIAMELLEGEELRSILARGERLSTSRAAELASRVVDALAYAHASGIVHRDIKPGNIFMASGGGKTQPKVLDFGIAQVARRPVSSTGGDTVLGSPTYMAPECVRGESVDGRSDIWSLGVTLYELLTGKTPFAGDSLNTLLQGILNDSPEPPHTLNSAVPLELSRIVARALAKRPEDRYQNAKDMADDLRRWVATNRVKRLIEESNASTSNVKVIRDDAAQRLQKRLMILGAMALAAVAVLLVMTFSAANRSEDDTASSAQSKVAQVKNILGGKPTPEPKPTSAPAVPTTAPAVVTDPALQSTAPAANIPAAATPSTAAPATDNAASTPPVPAAAAAPAAAEPTTVAAPSAPPAVAPSPDAPTAAALRAQKLERERKRAERAAAAMLAQQQRAQAATVTVQGQVLLAVSPWAEVIVDGVGRGTSPPLTSLSLSAGRHTIELRNGDAPPFVTTVQVEADNPVRIRHKF
jgi:eukaryotic-like serine/threonine-protein kinase